MTEWNTTAQKVLMNLHEEFWRHLRPWFESNFTCILLNVMTQSQTHDSSMTYVLASLPDVTWPDLTYLSSSSSWVTWLIIMWYLEIGNQQSLYLTDMLTDHVTAEARDELTKAKRNVESQISWAMRFLDWTQIHNSYFRSALTTASWVSTRYEGRWQWAHRRGIGWIRRRPIGPIYGHFVGPRNVRGGSPMCEMRQGRTRLVDAGHWHSDTDLSL